VCRYGAKPHLLALVWRRYGVTLGRDWALATSGLFSYPKAGISLAKVAVLMMRCRQTTLTPQSRE
jgi:hypothetical protein